MVSGYKTIREICLPRGGQHAPSDAKSRQHFILTKTIPNILFGGIENRLVALHVMIALYLLLHCQMSQTSFSILSSYETSHLSLSDSFPQMGTTPPYSPNGEITGPEQMRWSAQRCCDMDRRCTADREGEDDIVPMCGNFTLSVSQFYYSPRVSYNQGKTRVFTREIINRYSQSQNSFKSKTKASTECPCCHVLAGAVKPTD